jgi:hypothetical protein
MMCDWDREFGEEAKEKQKKSGEELTADMIKKKSCGVCKYANPSTVGYYMTDLFCLKNEEYLNFKYERPCSCFILDDYYLEKYGSAAQITEGV